MCKQLPRNAPSGLCGKVAGKQEHSKEVIKLYDWTHTTGYKGTLLGESLKLKVVPTTGHIDTEKLKVREQIKCFEVLLFENELHDHGVSNLRVKIKSNDLQLFPALTFFLFFGGSGGGGELMECSSE